MNFDQISTEDQAIRYLLYLCCTSKKKKKMCFFFVAGSPPEKLKSRKFGGQELQNVGKEQMDKCPATWEERREWPYLVPLWNGSL